MAQIGIVGMGSLGSSMAWLLARNGHHVLGWEHANSVVDDINRCHRNSHYVSDLVLPPEVTATNDVQRVFDECEIVFVTLLSRFFSSVFSNVSGLARPDLGLVNMTKGIDPGTGHTAYSLLSDYFPGQPTVMLAGPSLAGEFVRGVPTHVVAAGDYRLAVSVKKLIDNPLFRVSLSDDPLGVELGGVLKNIYAMGIGLFDASPAAGLNFIGAYLTQALSEIVELGVALGGKRDTFYQVCGIGDLMATAMSPLSHNRRMGEAVAAGKSLAQIEVEQGALPEGYNSLVVALRLARKHDVSLPLAQLLNRIIEQQCSVDEFFGAFLRETSRC